MGLRRRTSTIAVPTTQTTHLRSAASRAGRRRTVRRIRPRPGAEQRQFTFSDLVSLCVALGTTLFELLLPPTGVVVDELETGENSELTRAVRRAGFDEVADALYGDGRTKLGWVLFGMDGSQIDPKMFEGLVKLGQKQAARRKKIVQEITDEMWQRIKEEME